MLENSFLLKLALEQGTPLYVNDLERIESQARNLLKHVSWQNRQVLYAMKANYNPEILKLLLSLGLGVDTVSPAEVFLSKSLGFKPGDILFTANNCSDQDFEEVVAQGVCCNLDSLSAVRRYGQKFPNSKVCLRVNPDVVAGSHKSVQTAGTHAKFGILPEDLGKAIEIASQFSLKIVGLHEHTGSGILKPEEYLQGAKSLLDLVSPAKFPDLRFVDLGGGLGIPYRPEEPQLNIAELGLGLTKLFSDFCKTFGRNLTLYIEPGKFLVGEASVLLIQVTTLRNNRGRLIAGTNSGFNHLIRPVLYGAYHHIQNLSNPSAKKFTYDIVGNICESGDYFAEARELPELREGDILAIHNAGAYGTSMASLYNLRPLASEISVRGKEILSARKSLSSEEQASAYR